MAGNLRWSVITGASAGIGAELARVFAGRGYALYLVARREEKLGALARELSDAHRVPVEIMGLDLESPMAPTALHDALAGGASRSTPSSTMPASGFAARSRRFPMSGRWP